MKKRILLLFVLIALCAAGWYAYARYWGNSAQKLTIYGNVDIKTVNISPRVGGRLESLTVDEGDAVKAGQLLGQLDRIPYENSLAEAKANVAEQKAQLALLEAGFRPEEIAQVRSEVKEATVAAQYAETFYSHMQNLVRTNAVSRDDYDKAKTSRDRTKAALQASRDKLTLYKTGSRQQDIDAARARLMQAEAALAKAQLNLDDTRLKSPSDGTILTKVVEPGSMLNPGSPVFTLSLTNSTQVRAYVDEVNLARAVPGAKVHIYIDAKPDAPYTGSIGFVSPTAEFTPKNVQTPEQRTSLVFRLNVIVQDPDAALRQGMPVTIRFPESK